VNIFPPILKFSTTLRKEGNPDDIEVRMPEIISVHGVGDLEPHFCEGSFACRFIDFSKAKCFY